MALSFAVGTPVESTASVTSSSVPLAAGMAAGDYTILLCALNATTGTISTPAGWTVLLANTRGTANTSLAFAIFYRKWVSGDGNVTVATTSGRVGMQAIKVTGADPTTFIEVAATVTQAAASATAIVAPAVTSTGSTIGFFAYAARHASNGIFITWAAAAGSGMTEIAEAGGKATTATNASGSLFTAPITPGVSSGTKTANASAATTGAMGVSFVIKEAAGVAAPAFSGWGIPI